jgi:hypothetical protein
VALTEARRPILSPLSYACGPVPHQTMVRSASRSVRAISGATHSQFQKTSLINPEPHSGTKDASAPGYARNRKPLGKSSRACARRRRSSGTSSQALPRFDARTRAPHQSTYPKRPVLLRFRRDPAFTRQPSVRKRHGSGRAPVACFHPVHQKRLSIDLTRPAMGGYDVGELDAGRS